ncbi:MAG: dienelactone hydrolase family protein [Solirubrobacterales bacterium]
MRMRFWVVAALCLLALSPAGAQELRADSEGRLTFPSATYDGLPKLMKGEPAEAVTGEGVLTLPAGSAKVPAVVVLHTIGGRSDSNEGWFAKRLVEAGYATFLPDTFSPRGWRDMASKGGPMLAASQTADAFNALKLLATHPRIDAGRIAVIGFSLGGDSAHYTAFEPLRRALLPDDLRFAAHVPFYPAAVWGVVAGPASFTGAPVRFQLAEREDAGPLAKVLPYLDYVRRGGAPVEQVVYEGAYHAWTEERFTFAKEHPFHSSAKNCTFLLLNPAGPTRELTAAGEVAPVDLESWRACGKASRGYTQGFDSSVRAKSLEDLLRFLAAAMPARS